MNKLFALTSILSIAAALTGCGTVRDNVPATQISGSLNGHPFNFVGPKDVQAEKIIFSADTNGNVKAEIDGLKAATNPDIITMTGDAYAKMRTADAALIQGTINSLGTATGQAAGAVLK